MAIIEYRKKRTRQPQEAVGVDWDNPITNGLSFLWSATQPTNDVTRGFGPSGFWTTPSLIVPALGGLAARNAATASTRFDATKYAASTTYTLLAVILDDDGRGVTRNFFDSDDLASARIFQFRCTTGNVVEFIAFNTAGGNTSGFVSSTTTSSTTPQVVVARIGLAGEVKLNVGASVNTMTLGGTPRTNAIAGSRYSIGSNAGNTNPFPGTVYLTAAFTRALSDAEVASLQANPWQLFAPRSIWVPVSAAGGGVVTHATSGALTGQGSEIVGTAARTRAHATTGALAGPGSASAGTAAHIAKHATSGTLTGQGSAIAGTAARVATHETSGALVGQGAVVTGAASGPGTTVLPIPGGGGGGSTRTRPLTYKSRQDLHKLLERAFEAKVAPEVLAERILPVAPDAGQVAAVISAVVDATIDAPTRAAQRQATRLVAELRQRQEELEEEEAVVLLLLS